MRAKIKLRKILDKQIDVNVFGRRFPDTFEAILRAMKDACDQTVDLCSENAELEERDYKRSPIKRTNCGQEISIDNYDGVYYGVDKESILKTKEQIK